MLKGLMSTAVALAFLLGGGVVAMEAMGLIFQDGSADPERHIDAVVAHIEASLDPRDVPSEAEAEGLWPPEDGEKKPKLATGLDDAEPPSAVVGSAWTVRVVVETGPQTGPETAPPETGPEIALKTGPGAVSQAPDSLPPATTRIAAVETAEKIVAPAPEPVLGPVLRVKACTGASCNARTLAPKRARSSRRSANVGCPLSQWMAGL
jgi:hypothetical protein